MADGGPQSLFQRHRGLLVVLIALAAGMLLIFVAIHAILLKDLSTLIETSCSVALIDSQRSKIVARAWVDLAAAPTAYDRWTVIGDLAVHLIDDGEINAARRCAEELLANAPHYRGDWNYGNAIHRGHIALRRIALREHALEMARHHLLEAGRTPGPPQLNAFGPNMLLARELLEAGDTEAVLEYFDLVAVFWSLDQGRLSLWREMINDGDIPMFCMNLT